MPNENPTRLISLDIFRGLTIAGMILVNNPGSWSYVYKPLGHADWHGWTPADLIFPIFLFIVGVSVKLSLDKSLLGSVPLSSIYVRIVRRTLLLLLLGLSVSMSWGFEWSTLRLPGVLQRIAICYLVASLIYLRMARVRNGTVEFSPFAMAWLTGGLLLVYYLVMRFVPVPGHGVGLLDSKAGNLSAYIDRTLLGAHIWEHSKVFDPEGILSTVPAVASTLIGVLTAWWLGGKREMYRKLAMMFVAGTALMVGGYGVGIWFPINKNLWSSSYVLFTGGMALVFLAMCYWYADIKGYRRFTTPWLVFGTNAIAVYYLSSLAIVPLMRTGFVLDGEWISFWGFFYRKMMAPLFGEFGGSAAVAVCYVVLWMALMYPLYKKRIFIKV
jgi:predicted acyltransferase